MNLRLPSTLLVALLLSSTIASAQGGRGMRGGHPFTYASELAPWTGANNQQVLMKLIGTSEGRAIFQREDGKITTTPLQNLSEESRARVHECELNMKEAGYTWKAGFWYSTEDLAAAQQKATLSPTTGSTTSSTNPSAKATARPRMECKITPKKTNVNPGEKFGADGSNWSLTYGAKPLTLPVATHTVDVTVQNFSPAPQTYTIHWYVLGRPFTFKGTKGHVGPLRIVETYSETLDCKAQGFLHTAWTSCLYPDPDDVKELSGTLIKAARRLGRSPGNLDNMFEFHGIIVQLISEGQLVRSYSSSPKYTVTAETYPLTLPKKQ